MTRNFLLIVLLLAVSSNAVNKFNYYWTVKLTGDTVTVSKIKRNYDSIQVWSNKVSDTLNQVVPRFNWFSNHDSTFKWMNIDTIPSADTIYSKRVRADTIIAVKHLVGNVVGNVTGNLTGNVTGNVTGNISGDITGGAISGTTGSFSSTVGVDSLRSTKGISATIGRFSSLLFGDSAAITKGISATYGRFSNTLYGVTGSFSSGLTATTGGFSSNVTADSLVVTKGVSADKFISTSGSNNVFRKLYVGYDTSASYSFNSNAELVVRSPDQTSIAIVSPSEGAIAFADTSAGAGRYAGLLTYSHTDNTMSFRTNAIERMVMRDGKIGMNDASPDSTLDVTGSLQITGNAKIGGHLNAATATYTGTVNVDSIKSTKGLSATIGNFSAGVSATTGTFSSNVGVDSLRSTKGISATIGRFSSYLFGDSAAITKGISATIGRFSSIIFGDSIVSTKGIVATDGNFSDDVIATDDISGDSLYVRTVKSNGEIAGTTGGFSSTVGVDSLRSTKGLSATFGRFSSIVFCDSFVSAKGITATNGRFSLACFAPYLTTNSGDDNFTYEDTTFYDSLYDGTTYRARALARITRTGAIVVMKQPALSGTISSSTETNIRGIPSKFNPISDYTFTCIVTENSIDTIGRADLKTLGSATVEGIAITKTNGNYLNAGTGGIKQSSFTWIKD
jgi:hypothetical protein